MLGSSVPAAGVIQPALSPRMVLCRRCAHQVRVTTLRCPRCGWDLPYLRSRRWKARLPAALPRLTLGRRCPRCRRPTHRHASPAWARLLRTAAGQRCSYRACDGCGWRGAAFHRRKS